MAEQKRKISYGINFEVNDAELKKLKKQLEQLQKLSVVNYANQQGISLNNPATAEKQAHQLTKLKKDAAEFQRLMRLAYNPKTNSYNITKFNTALKQSGLNVKSFREEMQKTAEGRAVWTAQIDELTKFNTELKQSHKLLDALGTTLANTIKWTISSSIMQGVTRSISQAYGFAKNLDSALNDIRIVTGKSADEMARFAERANAVASNLGKGTNDYTRAALIYAQQGLGQKEIEERTAITLKTANVTGQSAEEVSEELTAVWNGYKVSAAQAELYVDRLAAVASTTASNLQELSTGMSKVASAAATLGVGEDQLAAQLSTIISVTRQAPETVGTALRTVYARITDIQAGLDEDGVTLGKYSGDMEKIGISVLDLNGNLRNMGEVMEEIGNKWSTMTQEQKIYLAQTMAGQRQYSNLMALFDNFDKYKSALNTAQNAEGKLQEQQDVYMDRLSTHVQQLTTATEHMWMGLVDTDGFKDVIDGLTTIVEKVDKLFQSIGGGKNLLQSLVPIVMSLTSKTVANGINTMIINSQLEKRQLRDQKSSQVLAQNEMEALQRKGQQGSQRYQVLKQKSEFLQVAPGTFSTQQMDEINKRWTGSLEAADAADKAKTELNQYSDITRSITTTLGNNAVDLKETLSIEDLENAIIDVGGQYDELSKKIEQYARDQDAINKQQDAARQKLIEAYSQTATKIVSEKNESQFKQFNVKNLRKYESTQAQIISQEQQKLNSLPALSDNKKHIIDTSALTGMFVIKRNKKKGGPTPDQISAIEKVKGFEEVQGIGSRDGKIEKIREIFENSIYQEIYEQMSSPKSAKNFGKAVRDRFAEIEQNAKKAIQQASNKQKAASQELLQRQQTTNTYQQNFQALKGNLQIQNVDKFQNNLQFLSQDFSSMAIPPELKTQVISIKKEYQKLSQEIIKYNEEIQSSSKLSQEQIDALKKEKKALEEKQQALLDTTQGTVDSINENVQNKGQGAIDELKRSRTIGNNNRDGIKDIQDDADRQKAIQAAIQLSSSLIQLQTSFSSIKEALSSDDGNQIFQNLLINIPFLISGIVTTINSVKVLKANIGLLGKEMTGTLIPGIKGVNTTLGATMITVAAGIAALMAIKAVAEAHQKSLQGQIKVNEDIIKTEKEKQEIYKNQLGIIAEVEELNNKYKQGAISKGQLIEKTQELQEKYKDESSEIKELISNYNHLQQAAKKAKENQLNELKKSKDKQLEAASRNVDWRLQGRQYSQNDLFDSFNIFAMAARSRGNAVFNAGWGQGKAEDSLAAALQQADLGGQFGSYIELYNAKTSQEAARQIEILQKWADTTSETNTDLFRNVQAFLEEQKPFLEDWKESQLQRLSIVSQSEALNHSQDFNNVNTVQEYQAAYREVYEKIYNKAEEEGDLEGLDSDKIKETITSQVNSIIPTKLKESYKSYVDVIDKIQSSNPNIKLTDSQKKEIFNLNEDQLNAFSTNSFELASNAQDIENAARNISKMDFSNMQPFTAASIESVAESYEKIQQIIKAIQEGKTIKNTAIKQLLEDKNFDFTEEQIKSLMQQHFSGNWEIRDDITQQQVIDFFRSKAIEKSQNDIKKNQSKIDILKNKPKVNDIKVQNESELSFFNLDKPLLTEQDFFIKDSKLKSDRSDGWYQSEAYNESWNQVEAFFQDYFNAKNLSSDPSSLHYSSGLRKALIEEAKAAGLTEGELEQYASSVQSGKSLRNTYIETAQMRNFRERIQNLLQKAPIWEDESNNVYGPSLSNDQRINENKTNANFMLDALNEADYEDQSALISWRKQVNNEKEGPSEDIFDEIKKAYQTTVGKLEKIPEDLKEAEEQLKEQYKLIYQQEFPTDLDIDKSLQKQLAEQFQLTAEKSELLDDALKNNAKNAKDVAAAILRYQAAIDKTADSYSSWIDILNNGSTAEKIKIMPDLKDAFGDVLDINGLDLSNTFATTSSNLELMRVALEDTGQAGKQAYEKLQQLAQLDILNNMGLNSEQIIEIQEQLNILKDFANESVKTGAEISYDDVKNYLEKILAINKDITSEQLTHLLTLMNIDADLVVVDGHIQKINTFAKSATYELKQQQTSTDKLKDLERERIKNQKELTKFLKDERDIYHQINRLLSDQERTIKRITRNQQDMYGTELLDNLNAESAEYKKQQKLLKSKQKLQQQDLANKKAALMSKGASFDANGNISNYNNLIGSATNNINSIISRERGVQEAMNQHLLNGGSTSDEVYKDLDLQLSSIGREKNQANDYFNDLKTDLSNYEKVKDQAEDVADQLTEISEKQIEINLKKFNMKLEVTLDLSQATKTWNDYKRDVLQHDDVLNPNRAKSIQKDNEQRMADINSDSRSLDVINQQIEKAMADDGTLYKTQGQKKKALEEFYKKASQLRKGILENEDAIKQTYLEQYDIISEMFEKQKSQYEFINNQLEHNKNMMSLVYGENDYAVQNVYNDKMIENNLKSIESMNNRVQIAEENLRKARESGNTAVIEKAEAEWQAAIQNRNQLEEQSAKLMKDRYTTAINQIAHQMEQKLTNNKGFNYMDTEWDLMKKQSNLYLDDINSAFAIKNTEYLYTQALNDTKSLKGQQQIKKVMNEQINILKRKNKLTQYDVDRAQKLLKIEEARIALEQERNNKTQMRLKRNSQGNYSYQYVADQDSVAKAKNDLQKAENDLYNFDKDNYENRLKEAYDATKEYQEKIAALEIEYATASEERRKQIDEEKRLLDQQYSKYILNLSQETEWGKQNLMDSAMMNYTDMMNQEQLDFENMSDAQKEKWLEDMVPSINTGIAEMIGKFSTDPDSFKQIIIDATQAMDNERKTYQQGLADLQKAAGQNWNNIKKAMDPVVKLQDSLIVDNDKLKKQAKEIVKEMDKTLNALNLQAMRWQNVYNKTDAAVKRVYDYIAAVDEAALKKLDEDKDNKGDTGNTPPTTYPGPQTGGTTPPKTAPSPPVTTPSPPKTKDNDSIKAKSAAERIFKKYFSPYFNYSEIKWHGGELNWKKIKQTFYKFLKVEGNSADEINQRYNALKGWLHAHGSSIDSVKKYGNSSDPTQKNRMDNTIAFSKVRAVVNNVLSKANEENIFTLLDKFDTGGYTGDWSSTQGKLAVLHQKELVLNKEDTANMLEMIAMVREMQQQELQFRLSSLNNEIQDVMKQNAQVEKIKTQQKLLEQSVAISASFPSVNSKKEIEEALSELMNKATQIALKYKKN